MVLTGASSHGRLSVVILAVALTLNTNASHDAQHARHVPSKPSAISTSTPTGVYLSRGHAPAVSGRSEIRHPMRKSSAPTSHVKPVDPWPALAKCEASGRWHLVSGNGFFGGLQFKPSTWVSFGGLRFARNAAAATPGEQVTIAQRVQRVQGWAAWPVCSRLIGLR